MGKIIAEYMDIKTQQECVSKTIDTLWKMAQKYQKIEQIWDKWHLDMSVKTNVAMSQIGEVLKDGKIN